MMLRRILDLLLTIGVILFIALLTVGIILGWSLGLGWSLTRWLDLSLFESSLLVIIASGLMLFIWEKFLNWVMPTPNTTNRYDADEDDEEDDDEDWETEGYPIPVQRFARTEEDRTNENWFRYELANGITLNIKSSSQARGLMNDTQIQELAIRVTDILVELIKEKPQQARRISVTTLKKTMHQMKMTPYDDAILRLAIAALKSQLNYPEARDILFNDLWDEMW